MKKKKNNALVFGGTGNHIPAMACVMMDIKRLCPGLVDGVVIFHDGVRRGDVRVLNQILPTKTVRYRFPITNRSRFNQGTLGHFSEMVFSKYEALSLLDEYHNVLFTDYDIVVTQPIAELFEPCSSGIKLLPAAEPVRVTLHHPVDDFDMERLGHSVAFVAVHDNLPDYKAIRAWCYEKTEKHAESLYLPEQAVFNFAVERFGLKPRHFDADIYCLHPHHLDRNPSAKILHAYGSDKFWNGLENLQWRANYNRWLEMGGGPIGPRRQPWTARKLLRHLLISLRGGGRR